MIQIQQPTFDWNSLDADTFLFVKERTESIHSHLKNTANSVIAIGFDLLEVKATLPHGQFVSWVHSEFDMSRRMAHNFMAVAQRFGDKCAKFAHLPVSVLYELAAPSTPDTIIEQVESGQISATLPAIREAKQQAKAEHPIEGETEIIPASAFVEEIQTLAPDVPLRFPEGWGLVDGKPFDMPLPDGKPLDKAEFEQVFPPLRGVPPALQMSESNEWYTPAEYVESARELMGGIDVDPASNELANQVVQATTFYDSQSNGFDKPWYGRIWLNPPYGLEDGKSNQERWTHRLIEQYEAGITKEAVLLVNANTEAKWFQPLYDYLICFTNHRIRFYNAQGDSSQPTQGNALIYFGKQRTRFIGIFSRFGTVIERAKADGC